MRVKGLVPKGQKFQFQAAIPRDVRAAFGGRTKFTAMIDTSVEEQAVRFAEKYWAEFQSRVYEQRQIAINQNRLSEDRIAEVAAYLFGKFHEEEFEDSYVGFAEAVQSRIIEGNNEEEAILYGLPLEGPDFDRIVRQVKSMVNNTGSVRTFITDRNRWRVTPLKGQEERGTLVDAGTRWAKTNKRVTAKTVAQYQSDVAKFSAWYELKRGPCFGSKIGRRDVNDYMTLLMSKDVALATITRTLSSLKFIFKFGQFSDDNPFSGVKDRMIIEGRKLKVRRFSDREVLAILKMETDPNSRMALIIAAYSGMRLSEIADAKIQNIVKIGSHRVFDLKNAGKKKTEAGYRNVPIHRRVWKELGPFVKGREPEEYILSDEPLDRFGSRSQALSKRIARVIDKVAPDPAAREHSFRHTVISKMADAGVRKEIRIAIVGHAGDDVHDNYTHREAVEELAQAIEKIAYK